MNTCDLLEFEAQSFKEKLLIEFSLDEIIKNEKWICQLPLRVSHDYIKKIKHMFLRSRSMVLK